MLPNDNDHNSGGCGQHHTFRGLVPVNVPESGETQGFETTALRRRAQSVTPVPPSPQ